MSNVFWLMIIRIWMWEWCTKPEPPRNTTPIYE